MPKTKEMQYLDQYHQEDFDRPSVAADIVIFSIYEEELPGQRKLSDGKLSVLLIRRNEYPYKDCWALPGGFWRKEESMEECALRELTEETGLKQARLVPIGSFSRPGRDPRGWILSNVYMAPVVREDAVIRGGSDAAEAAWFTIETTYDLKKSLWTLTLTSQERAEEVILQAEILQKTGLGGMPFYETLSGEGIAFDHGEILVKARRDLQRHLTSDELAYEFLSREFTIIKLQKVHEIVLKQPLLAANFRRKIADEIEETGTLLEGKAFRPAMLYRKKEKER